MISLVYILVQSNLMWSRIISDLIIKQLSIMLDKTEAKTFVGSDEFINILLAIIENITGNHKILLNYALPIIKYILPVLQSKF